MDNSVVIKGSKHGITVLLDENMDFEGLKSQINEKFANASKFFGNADLAISFEGRKLTIDEENEILKLISNVSDLKIVCVMESDDKKDEQFERAVRKVSCMKSEDKSGSEDEHSDLSNVSLGKSTAFCKGTLRSGQLYESESSVVVLGDVNPGGKVVAKGNVVVLGSLRGNVFAGAGGNENAFVVALEMNPMQIKIGDVIARSADTSVHKKTKSRNIQPKIAYVYDGNIYVEDLEQEVLADITI